MKKYMVITCLRRNINEPEFFDSFLKAQIYLFKMFCDACRYIDTSKWEIEIHDEKELEETLDSLANEELLDFANDYNYTEAWCETANHDDWDGKIFEIEF